MVLKLKLVEGKREYLPRYHERNQLFALILRFSRQPFTIFKAESDKPYACNFATKSL